MKTDYKLAIAAGLFSLLALTLYNAEPSLEALTASENVAIKNVIHPAESNAESKYVLPMDSTKNSIHSFQDFQNNIPSYLRNTELRGQLSTLEDGSLLISDEIRKRFDYFYIMIGDRSLSEINAIIIDHISQELAEPAQSQALLLLQQYTDYLNEYSTFSEGVDIRVLQDDPHWMASEINALRIFHLGEETSHIFFAQQEILRNNYLNPDRDSLSTHLLANQKQTLQLSNLQAETAAFKASYADNETLHNMRIGLVGKEAANRLALLDSSRQKWQKKKQAYQALKTQWNNTSGLTDHDKADAFEKLAMQDLGLTMTELKRLRAIEYIQSKRG